MIYHLNFKDQHFRMDSKDGLFPCKNHTRKDVLRKVFIKDVSKPSKINLVDDCETN